MTPTALSALAFVIVYPWATGDQSEHALYFFLVISCFCFRFFFLFSYLSVFGEIQRPFVCLLSCDMYIEKVYLGVPVSREVVLHNQSLLKARFTWEEVGTTLKGLLSILNPAEHFCFLVAFMKIPPVKRLDVMFFLIGGISFASKCKHGQKSINQFLT